MANPLTSDEYASKIDLLIRSYLSRTITLKQLKRSIEFPVQMSLIQPGSPASRLYGRALCLFDEHGYGHRTEKGVRLALRALMRESVPADPEPAIL